MKNTAVCAVAGLLLSIPVLNAFEKGLEGTVAVATEPCEPALDLPETPTLAAPYNLRIIKGLAAAMLPIASWSEPVTEGSGPFVPEIDATSIVPVSAYAYFDSLRAREDCLAAFPFRSQANIDSLPSRGESVNRMPIVYSSAHDAAKFEIDPSGALPNSGSTSTPQKRMPIGVQGATTVLITWDMKIAESMRYRPDKETRMINGESRTVGYLDQHKSHRVDDRSAEPWVGMKQNYAKGTNSGRGIAYVFFNARKSVMGPGTTQGSSEMISPAVGEFYVQPDVWTRVWIFVEGNIGTGDNAVRLSIWLADEHRAPVQLYDRVNMVAPADGIGLFRYEFNSSTNVALNGPGQQYQRNWVLLRGVPLSEVSSLLQKPMK